MLEYVDIYIDHEEGRLNLIIRTIKCLEEEFNEFLRECFVFFSQFTCDVRENIRSYSIFNHFFIKLHIS